MNNLKLALLNTTIATTDGVYEIKTVNLKTAILLVENNIGNIDSAIGHKSTADVMSTLLKTPIDMNRQLFLQQAGQTALVFKLKGRPEEGKILSVKEIENIGYEFKTIKRLK